MSIINKRGCAGALPTLSNILKSVRFSKQCSVLPWRSTSWGHLNCAWLLTAPEACWQCVLVDMLENSGCARSKKVSICSLQRHPQTQLLSHPYKPWNLALTWPSHGWKSFSTVFRIGKFPLCGKLALASSFPLQSAYPENPKFLQLL